MMLTVICPGLLGPLPYLPQPRPPLPTLKRLLGRALAQQVALTSPEAAVLAACGCHPATPTGALSLYGEAGDWDASGNWFHADPVHLRPDREQLLLFSGATIAPNAAEAAALVALFNQHFAADGLHLLAATPERWYLRTAQPVAVDSPPLAQVQGRALHPDMMTGADARRWQCLLNETQMLFFNSEVNRLREQQRRPLISGMWTWGGGQLPQMSTVALPQLIGDLPLLRGLARHAAGEHRPLAQWLTAATPVANSLIYWDNAEKALQKHDVAAWATALVELDAALAAPERQLRAEDGQLALLVPEMGQRFQVSRTALRRFWRRQDLFALMG